MPPATDGLTRSQLAAVMHPAGPLMLLGGPGTGKTTVLERRFAWLVEQGAAPDGVLALALAEPAAAAMRGRVEALVDPPYDELRVDTFRSFCARLLRDEAMEAGLDPAFAPVTRADRVALLLDCISELRLRHHEIGGNPAALLAGFVGRIDRLKEEMVDAGELLSHAQARAAESSEGDDASRARAARELEFAGVYTDHERLLGERGAVDTGDLVLRAFRLLHERPHVRERTARRFGHVLVDEYQDVNFAQAMLLGLLGEEHREVTVAGDPEAAIHRYGGAAAKNFDDFRAAFDPVTEVGLTEVMRTPSQVRFWRCASERAQAQAVAADAERLISDGVSPARIGVLVRSVESEGAVVASALEERAVPFTLTGPAAYFQRAEVRDVLAWLRVLADPSDAGAAVRALSRPPIEIHSVDVARLTQLARRRKLDIPAAVAAALEGPQLTPEGRDRAQAFLRLYRAASGAFENRRPDRFVLRLIERIGVRRQQVFATQADTVERLRNIARLPELATAYVRREPGATARDFTRYLKAVADSGLREEEDAVRTPATPVVRVMAFDAAKGTELDHTFVLGLTSARMPGRDPGPSTDVPSELLKEVLPADGGGHEAAMRRLLGVALSRASEGMVLAWAEGQNGSPARPSPFYTQTLEARGATEDVVEEELFGPGEGLHSTFRIMRDELLDTVARTGGRLGEMRLDTGVDVSNAVARYLELIKVAALIDRSKAGQPLADALAEVNAMLAQGATAEQREVLEASGLDDWLRDTAREAEGRPAAGSEGSEPSLDPFIPRRRGGVDGGLMLSASDIETYRICPLKYKFARVFRIPQESSIYQRFGIALHQVLERFHRHTKGSREELMELFESSWRRGGFGDSDDELQFRERALDALDRYWERTRSDNSEPVWFERSFSFSLGPHLLRGRVDRVDRRPDGSYELIDYKTGRSKTEEELSSDVQLSIYQMGARESWKLDTTAQSYHYVMTGEKVPIEHSEAELERVRHTVAEIGAGIQRQDFQPTPRPDICRLCDYRIICPAAET